MCLWHSRAPYIKIYYWTPFYWSIFIPVISTFFFYFPVPNNLIKLFQVIKAAKITLHLIDLGYCKIDLSCIMAMSDAWF